MNLIGGLTGRRPSSRDCIAWRAMGHDRGVASPPLPLIDVRSVEVGASSVRCWRAVIDVMSRSADGPGARVFAAGISCADRGSSGKPDEVGAAFPGFHVVRSEPPFLWGL